MSVDDPTSSPAARPPCARRRRVAVRCPYGLPAVTEQAPYTADGEPFPTTYWLTCPQLVAAVSRLEAAGGVERWSARPPSDPELGASLARADAEQRRDPARARRSASAARAHPRALKCLHAHVALALARPGYELGERILAEAGERWCPDARCAAPERPA